MALDKNEKILDGKGLKKYTELLSSKFDEAETTLVGGASDEGNTLKKLEDRLANVESTQSDDGDAILTLINEVYGEGVQPDEPSRIDNLEDAVNDITTTTIPGIQDQITALTTSLTTTYKVLQTTTTITTPAGSYINSLSQNDQGVITGTTSTFPTAATTTQGMVTMDSGATTSVVYDKAQIDSMIDGASGDISGLDTRMDEVEADIDTLKGRADALEGDAVGTGAKKIQAAVTSPAVGSTPTIEFIDTISQNANGDITASKQTVRNASAGVTGVIQMATGATTNIAYDSKQVDDKIAEAVADAIASVFKPEVVVADADGLPDVASPEENVIYLVPNGTETSPNYYIEYIWMSGDPEGHWEEVGNTELAIETLNTDEVTDIFNAVWNPVD